MKAISWAPLSPLDWPTLPQFPLRHRWPFSESGHQPWALLREGATGAGAMGPSRGKLPIPLQREVPPSGGSRVVRPPSQHQLSFLQPSSPHGLAPIWRPLEAAPISTARAAPCSLQPLQQPKGVPRPAFASQAFQNLLSELYPPSS